MTLLHPNREAAAAAEIARNRAAAVLAAKMTPAQQWAFAHPALDPKAGEDPRFNRLLDDQLGDTAWRVCLILDASPQVPERWPCWHCTAVWGEKRNGIARQAVPLYRSAIEGDPYSPWISMWPNMRWRKGEALIRKELRGVGYPDTLMIVTRDALAQGAKDAGMKPHELCGISGRVKLTRAEAAACLPAPVLARFTTIAAGAEPQPVGHA